MEILGISLKNLKSIFVSLCNNIPAGKAKRKQSRPNFSGRPLERMYENR